MNKIEFIESYIKRCDEIIESGNEREADKLQDEIIGTFESEIKDIRSLLDNYRGFWGENLPVDFIGDLKLLKQKLLNYVMNLKEEEKKMKYELELARLKQPQISNYAEALQTQSTEITINTTININQSLEMIDKIPEEKLSLEDKDNLKKQLTFLEGIKATQNKNEFWKYAKGVLKFIADKGADAAIAAMPYILACLGLLK